MRIYLFLGFILFVIGIAFLGLVLVDGDILKMPDLLVTLNEEGFEGLLGMAQSKAELCCVELRQTVEEGIDNGLASLRGAAEGRTDGPPKQGGGSWLDIDWYKRLLRAIKIEIDSGIDSLFERFENGLEIVREMSA